MLFGKVVFFEITNDNTVTFSDPLMSVHFNELFLCASLMAQSKSMGQHHSLASSLSWSMSDQEIQDAFRAYTARNPQGFIAPIPERTVFAGKGQERRFTGRNRDLISSSAWSAATDFAMNCAHGYADKIVPGKAVLFPLRREIFFLQVLCTGTSRTQGSSETAFE